jgi:glycosyltransferase involved in cell wall biosynthesis
VTYVGRFVEAKGMHELLAAFSALAARDPDASLALVGDGVMRSQLVAMVAAAGLQDRVHMPGGLEPAQVAEWIAASNVLALPSWSEGYPNVVVEAVACGCPVVASDVGGAGEIIHAGNGLLVPARDAAALERALEDAMSRTWDAAAMSAGCSRGWDAVAVDTLAACEEMLAQWRQGAATRAASAA